MVVRVIYIEAMFEVINNHCAGKRCWMLVPSVSAFLSLLHLGVWPFN